MGAELSKAIFVTTRRTEPRRERQECEILDGSRTADRWRCYKPPGRTASLTSLQVSSSNLARPISGARSLTSRVRAIERLQGCQALQRREVAHLRVRQSSDCSAVRPFSGARSLTRVYEQLSDCRAGRPFSGARSLTCVPGAIERLQRGQPLERREVAHLACPSNLSDRRAVRPPSGARSLTCVLEQLSDCRAGSPSAARGRLPASRSS